jgi:ribose transport system substrate-binding protein
VTFSPDPTSAGGIGSISIDRFEAGRAVAAYMAVEGGGDVVVFNQNDSPEVAEQAKGLRAGLKEFSPGAKVLAEQSIPNTQMGAPQEQIMSGILQQNPEGTVKWVYAGFDFMLTPLVNVVEREGRKEIRGVSFDGNLENLDFIRKGIVQSAVIGYPLEWSGWGAIDQLNRSLQGKPLAKDEGVRFRLLTKDNIPESGKSYVGDVDFEAKYRQLWGK